MEMNWYLLFIIPIVAMATAAATYGIPGLLQRKKDSAADSVKKAPEPAPAPADAPKVDTTKLVASTPPETKVEAKTEPVKARSRFFHTPARRLVRNFTIVIVCAGAGWWIAGGAEAPFAPATPDAPEASPAEGDGAAAPVATPALDAVTNRLQTLYNDYVKETPVGDALAFAASLSNDLGQTFGLPEHSITYVLGGILALVLLYVLYRVIRAVWRAFLGQTWLTGVLVLMGAVATFWYLYQQEQNRRFVEHPELVRENGEEVHVSPRVGVQTVYVEWNEKLVMHPGNNICMRVSIADEWLEANNIDTPFPQMNYEETTGTAFTYVATPALQGELRMQGIPQQFTVTGTRC